MGDRLSVSLALVLTAVAYKLTIAANIPQVNYLTLLDRYVVLCFLFITMAAVENSVMPFMCPDIVPDDRSTCKPDTVIGALWLFGWLSCSIWYVLWCRFLRWKRSRAE